MEMTVSTIKSRILEVWRHAGFQKYFRNTGWLFLEKIFRLVIGLFVSVWVARYLGPSQYGLYNYAISFAGLFTVISTFGLDGIVVRELVKDGDKRDLLMGTAFILKLIGAVVSLIVLAISIFLMNNTGFENFLIFIVASSVIFQSFSVIDFYFQSKVLSKYIVFSSVISFVLSSFLKILFIINKASLINFVWVVLFDSIVLALGYLYFYKRQDLKLFSWKFDFVLAKSLLKDSWPLILSGIAVTIYMKIDQVMIKNMLGNEEVGLYSVAVRLSELWYFIPVLITSSLFPAILNAKKISNNLYNQRLKKMYFFVFYLSFFIAIFTTFFATPIVNLLYGVQYQGAIVVLKVYIWSGVFVSFGMASGSWYLVENLQFLSFLRTFIGAIINILLNIVFINKFGIQGAAVSTLISYSFAGYFFDLFTKKTRNTFMLKTRSLFILN